MSNKKRMVLSDALEAANLTEEYPTSLDLLKFQRNFKKVYRLMSNEDTESVSSSTATNVKQKSPPKKYSKVEIKEILIYAKSVGFSNILYPNKQDLSRGKGFNAGIIINDNNVSPMGANHSEQIANKEHCRIVSIDEAIARGWCPLYKHLNYLYKQMVSANKIKEQTK